MSRFAYSAYSPPCGGYLSADDDCVSSPSMFSPACHNPSAQLFSEPTSNECPDFAAEWACRSLQSPVKHLSRWSSPSPILRESSDEPSDEPQLSSTVVSEDELEGEDADSTSVPVVLLSATYSELNFGSSPTGAETSEGVEDEATTTPDRAEFSRKRKAIQTMHSRKLAALLH